jgi:two-component system OmpR family sensor kinase
MMIELFLLFIFNQYQNIEEEHIRTNVFLEMKNYSLDFEDTRFDIDIISQENKQTLYELNEDEKNLFILVPFQDSEEDVLKILYPLEAYEHLVDKVGEKQRMQFFFLTFIAIIISILAAIYSLRPIRSSLRLLEDFIKDIIHDLNTPLTSILISLKMIDGKSDEIENITRAAKNIAMLHENLDSYLQEVKKHEEQFSLKLVIEEQVKFFAPRYDYLAWDVAVDECYLSTDKNAFTRIVYNLLSNACKYNTSDGYIKIDFFNNILTIENKSYGVKEPSRVFERFYKESERGLGIGLHIVEKLCTELKIGKSFELDSKDVKVTLNLSGVTSK